jgi:hypothetical protein
MGDFFPVVVGRYVSWHHPIGLQSINDQVDHRALIDRAKPIRCRSPS